MTLEGWIQITVAAGIAAPLVACGCAKAAFYLKVYELQHRGPDKFTWPAPRQSRPAASAAAAGDPRPTATILRLPTRAVSAVLRLRPRPDLAPDVRRRHNAEQVRKWMAELDARDCAQLT